MSVELTIETVEETIVLELQDHVPAVLTIDHIPELRDELASKVDAVDGMGLSELSFTTVDKLSLDQSEQDRHTHNNKPVIDGLSDDAGVLQYKGLPISDQAALDAKVDKVAGYSLVDDAEIEKLSTVEQYAQKNTVNSVAGKQGDVLLDKSDVGLSEVDNTADADKPVSSAVAAALADKVDAEAGKQLSDENYTLAEKDKLDGIAEQATKNRADSENADKVHEHVIADVTGLTSRLNDIDSLLIITKETFRVSLGLSEDVPFSQYAAYIPWNGEGVPTTASVFDFSNNRYARDGEAVYLTDMPSQFTRLSSATMWIDDQLVSVGVDVPRISGEGLLIEPQRTNSASSIYAAGAAVLSFRGVGALGSGFIDVSQATSAVNYINVASGSNNNRSISCILSNIPNEGVTINIAGGINLCEVFPDGTSTSLNAATVSLKSTKVSSGVYVAVGVFRDTPSNFRIYASSAAGVFTIDALSVEYDNSSPTSLMSRLSGQTTRAKETLVIPLLAGQTVTVDKDEGVTMTIVDNNAVFEGQGYIRSIEVN